MPAAVADRTALAADHELLPMQIDDCSHLDIQDFSERDDSSYFGRPFQVAVIILSTLGIVANAFGLAVISRHRGSTCSPVRLHLLISLGAADALVSATTFVRVFTNRYVTHQSSNYCLMAFLDSLWPTVQIISLLNLLGMAVDRYAAIVHPLHYDLLLSERRASVMIATFWAAAALLGTLDAVVSAAFDDTDGSREGNYKSGEFSDYQSASPQHGETEKAVNATETDNQSSACQWVATADGLPIPADRLLQHETHDYCQHVVNGHDGMHPDYVLLFVVTACLVIMSILHTRIYLEICRAAQRRLSGTVPLAMADNQWRCHRSNGTRHRGLVATWLILGTFLVCWLPGYLITLFLNVAAALHNPEQGTVFGEPDDLGRYLNVQQLLLVPMLINYICDPVIYMSHVGRTICSQEARRRRRLNGLISKRCSSLVASCDSSSKQR